MVARRRSRALWPSAIALTLALVVSGCGENSADPDRPQELPSQSTPTSAEPTESASATEAASATETPAQSPSQSPSPSEETTVADEPKMLAALPLPAKELPGFNEQFTWKVKANRAREGRRPFGTCHKFAMTSIGATNAAVRTYAPARRDAGATAANLVATFPDVKTAKRAYEVLKSWRTQCGEELSRHDSRDIGQLQPVDLPAGTPPTKVSASWYLLIYGPAKSDPDAGYFDAQGLARVGKMISVLEMRLVGQDYNYELGQEPMVGAVTASVARLAGS